MSMNVYSTDDIKCALFTDTYALMVNISPAAVYMCNHHTNFSSFHLHFQYQLSYKSSLDILIKSRTKYLGNLPYQSFCIVINQYLSMICDCHSCMGTSVKVCSLLHYLNDLNAKSDKL